jgi:2-hydroxychromene-2-carboxylate isomerase
MTDVPTLYFDLGSPYAYLAAERAEAVLGVRPRLEPVLLGAIFGWRGWGSWSQTEEREPRIADLQRRAAEAGLPRVAWPPGWPGNGLRAMRAATWATREGAGEAFALAAFRRAFVDGEDITAVPALAAIAAAVGLDGERLAAGVEEPDLKEALKASTAAAWAAGVRGIPTIAAGGALFYGDDRLPDAAAALRSAA